MQKENEKKLTADKLRALLIYDPETGVFTNRVTRRGSLAGARVGSKDAHGHINIGINYHTYKAHRLAWLYVYGEWPPDCIDHINRDPADNRICNLRVADKSVNAHNTGPRCDTRSGEKGVSWHKAANKWRAYYTNRGVTMHIGLFDTFEEAVSRRREAMSKIQCSA
jgi:hypothetical protein